MRQIKIALRRLLRQPGFTAAAIGVLAIGVAAPTAMFAVVNATLLRPLPYTRASDLYTVRTTMTDGRFTIGLVASTELHALERSADVVEASALTRRTDGTIEDADTGAREVAAYAVSQDFFDLFGVPMAVGRSFTDDDTRSWMGSRLVLSHHVWMTLFGGDRDVVGRTIRFAGGPGSLVVGVAPAAFAIPADADLWFVMPPEDSIGHMYDAYVRLAPGVTPGAVQARLGPMWDDLAKQYPDQDKNRAFVMRPLLDAIVGDLGPIVVIVFAATGLVLLLAIVNVANLLLVRGTTRGREMAVRAALGATRGHLFRELLAESILIAAAATVIALPLADAAVRAIVSIGGTALPRVDGMRLDLPVFLFSAGVMVIAGIVVGLVPLVTMAKNNLGELMNEGGRGGLQGRTTRRVLATMIVAEMTLAIALVAGAGRLLLSMEHIVGIDPGFTAEGRLAIDVYLPVRPYLVDLARVPAWLQQAGERLRALGATGVGDASSLPLRHEWDSTTFVDITGRPTDPASRPNGRLRVVSAGFFDVMNMKMAAGRSFTLDDRQGSEPVVIVNEAWARKFLPGLDPLRERVDPHAFSVQVDGRFVGADGAIVGVVRDVPYADVTTAAEPTVYVSSAQVIRPRHTLVITTANGRPEDLIPQIRAALAKIDPQVPVDFESMSRVVSTSRRWPKLGLLLMATLGAAGLVLAAAGVFGVIAFVAAQRSGEMAVRLALGATRGHVFRLIVAQGGALALVGLVLGVLLSWWMGGPMSRYVYEVAPANWLVLGGSAGLVLVVAIGATLPSARRAATTDPARVLKF
jgi:putative ABC transport system permease protein